jgi:hypothetical protein
MNCPAELLLNVEMGDVLSFASDPINSGLVE